MFENILSLLIPESFAGYFKENVIEGRLLRINAAEAHLIFLQYFQYLNKIVPSPCTACNELVVGIGNIINVFQSFYLFTDVFRKLEYLGGDSFGVFYHSFEFLCSTLGYLTALIHYGDTGAYLLDFFHVVGGVNYSRTFTVEL